MVYYLCPTYNSNLDKGSGFEYCQNLEWDLELYLKCNLQNDRHNKFKLTFKIYWIISLVAVAQTILYNKYLRFRKNRDF